MAGSTAFSSGWAPFRKSPNRFCRSCGQPGDRPVPGGGGKWGYGDVWEALKVGGPTPPSYGENVWTGKGLDAGDSWKTLPRQPASTFSQSEGDMRKLLSIAHILCTFQLFGPKRAHFTYFEHISTYFEVFRDFPAVCFAGCHVFPKYNVLGTPPAGGQRSL